MRKRSAARPPTMQELLIITRDLRAAKAGRWDGHPAVTYLASPSEPPRRVAIPHLIAHDGTLPGLRRLADIMQPVQHHIQLYSPRLAVLTCPSADREAMLMKIYVRDKAPRIFRFPLSDLKLVEPDNAHTWEFFEIKEDLLPVDLFPVDPRKTLVA